MLKTNTINSKQYILFTYIFLPTKNKYLLKIKKKRISKKMTT